MTDKPDYEPPCHYPLHHRIELYDTSGTSQRILLAGILFDTCLVLRFTLTACSNVF